LLVVDSSLSRLLETAKHSSLTKWAFNLKATAYYEDNYFLIILVAMFIAQTAIAGDRHDRTQSGGDVEEIVSSIEDLSQAEYFSNSDECTVM
jgi:hypothetical protein